MLNDEVKNSLYVIHLTYPGSQRLNTLALLLAKLKRKPYEVTRIKHDVKDRIKRLGVYYMCIDDLPL